MGQRLVIDVKKNNKRICNIYFHWGAYSLSAFYILRDIITLSRIQESHDAFDRLWFGGERNIDTIIGLISVCEFLGGGIDWEDAQFAQETYPWYEFKTKNISRNKGLVAITENTMQNNDNAAEGTACIDLDHKTIDNGCFFVETKDELLEWAEECDDTETIENIKKNKVPNLKYMTGNIPFDKLDETIEYFATAPELLRIGKNRYLTLIQ